MGCGHWGCYTDGYLEWENGNRGIENGSEGMRIENGNEGMREWE